MASIGSRPRISGALRALYPLSVLGLAGCLAMGCASSAIRGGASPSAADDTTAPSVLGPVVIEVDGESLRVADLPRSPKNPERRRAMLERYAAQRLVTHEALRRGIAEKPEVALKLAEVRRQARFQEEALLGRALWWSMQNEIEPDEVDLMAWYEARPDNYQGTRLVGFRWPLPGEESARRVAGESGPPPADATPVGYWRRSAPDSLKRALGREPAPIVRAAFEEADRWWVVQIDSVETRVKRPFELVRRRVEADWRRAEADTRMKALADRLMEERPVTIHQDVVDDDSLWPSRLGQKAP